MRLIVFNVLPNRSTTVANYTFAMIRDAALFIFIDVCVCFICIVSRTISFFNFPRLHILRYTLLDVECSGENVSSCFAPRLRHGNLFCQIVRWLVIFRVLLPQSKTGNGGVK